MFFCKKIGSGIFKNHRKTLQWDFRLRHFLPKFNFFSSLCKTKKRKRGSEEEREGEREGVRVSKRKRKREKRGWREKAVKESECKMTPDKCLAETLSQIASQWLSFIANWIFLSPI